MGPESSSRLASFARIEDTDDSGGFPASAHRGRLHSPELPFETRCYPS